MLTDSFTAALYHPTKTAFEKPVMTASLAELRPATQTFEPKYPPMSRGNSEGSKYWRSDTMDVSSSYQIPQNGGSTPPQTSEMKSLPSIERMGALALYETVA